MQNTMLDSTISCIPSTINFVCRASDIDYSEVTYLYFRNQVDECLQDLNFLPQVAESGNPHDYYIPENIFYRLCMKANTHSPWMENQLITVLLDHRFEYDYKAKKKRRFGLHIRIASGHSEIGLE